jgi:hypothetical protein
MTPNLHHTRYKNGQRCCPFELAHCSGKNYIVQCSTAIGVAVLLPFLGVSSLNFGPLARVAFFLRCAVLSIRTGEPQLELRVLQTCCLLENCNSLVTRTYLV